MGLETTLRFGDSLELPTELRKALILLQFITMKEYILKYAKAKCSQSRVQAEDSSPPLPGELCGQGLIPRTTMCDNMHKVLLTSEAYASLDILFLLGFVSRCSRGHRLCISDLRTPSKIIFFVINYVAWTMAPKGTLYRQSMPRAQRLSPRSYSRARPCLGRYRV